jgi:hypothetical protein
MAFRVQIVLVPAMGLALLGCAASDPIDFPSAGSGGAEGIVALGSGGVTSTGGVPGTGGATSTGGATRTGGASGTGGVTGTGGAVTSDGGARGTGRGGATATGGRAGASGTGGRLGAGGAGGKAATGGATGTGGASKSDGGVGTFTAVYADVISKYCFGSGCHNPAGSGRPSFASQSSCYTYFKNQGQLHPGQDPTKSYIYFIMSGDPTASPPSPPYMPPSPNANVSASDLAIVAAWIADGALDD